MLVFQNQMMTNGEKCVERRKMSGSKNHVGFIADFYFPLGQKTREGKAVLHLVGSWRFARSRPRVCGASAILPTAVPEHTERQGDRSGNEC